MKVDETRAVQRENAGLNVRIPARKPLISLKNQRKRLEFAKEHQVWNQAKWNNVFFSDDTKFNLFGIILGCN